MTKMAIPVIRLTIKTILLTIIAISTLQLQLKELQ